jgi:hypothetical protein
MGALSPSGDYLRTPADNGLTVSRCIYCQQIIGAGKEMGKVEIAEDCHECAPKREAQASELPPKIPSRSDRRKVARTEPEERNR